MKKHMPLSPQSLGEIRPQLVKINSTYRKPDGNNVDIDREMATLAENSLEFRTYTRFMSDRITGISSAIKGTG